MTWTLAGTTDPTKTSYVDHWNNIFRNYLSTRTGWTAVESTTSTNKTTMTYTFTNLYDNQPWTFYSYYNGSSSLVRDSKFTTTPGDLETTNYGTSSMYTTSPTLGEVWKIWYSSANPRAMLVTDKKNIILYIQGFSEGFVFPGALSRADWLADGSQNDPSSYWGPMTYTCGTSHGAPLGSGIASTLYTSVGFSPNNNNSISDGVCPALLSNIPMFNTSSSNNAKELASTWIYAVNQDDVRFHCPGGGSSSSLASGWPATWSYNAVLILSGSRYWLRKNPNLSQNSWMFDFGDTEPDFSEFP